jgi:hypothetical protein
MTLLSVVVAAALVSPPTPGQAGVDSDHARPRFATPAMRRSISSAVV